MWSSCVLLRDPRNGNLSRGPGHLPPLRKRTDPTRNAALPPGVTGLPWHPFPFPGRTEPSCPFILLSSGTVSHISFVFDDLTVLRGTGQMFLEDLGLSDVFLMFRRGWMVFLEGDRLHGCSTIFTTCIKDTYCQRDSPLMMLTLIACWGVLAKFPHLRFLPLSILIWQMRKQVRR